VEPLVFERKTEFEAAVRNGGIQMTLIGAWDALKLKADYLRIGRKHRT
jgi:hypothetical protein